MRGFCDALEQKLETGKHEELEEVERKGGPLLGFVKQYLDQEGSPNADRDHHR
jgi:hypothetical protein